MNKNNHVEDSTARAEIVKDKSARLSKRPILVRYEAFKINDDGSRESLGIMIGQKGENMLGAAYKRAFLLASDSTNVGKVKIERIP